MNRIISLSTICYRFNIEIHLVMVFSTFNRIEWWRAFVLACGLEMLGGCPHVGSCIAKTRQPGGHMHHTTKQPRINRTITIDFQNEATYFQLLGDRKAFLECVLAFILSIGFQ